MTKEIGASIGIDLSKANIEVIRSIEEEGVNLVFQ